MGKRGPAGKPTALRVLHGDQESRINRLEPIPTECEVRPATELSSTAAEVWNRLGPDLAAKKVLTSWDVDQFAAFCTATATFYEASRQLAENGMTAQGAAGGVIKSPYWQIMRDASAIMTQVGGRFGLTPSDRANLTMGGQENPQGASRLLR